MLLAQPTIPGSFIRRLNRFAALVEVGGETALAHVPNSGRLHELFVPSAPVLLSPVSSQRRVTGYDLVMVCREERWVSMDARLPNRLVAEALETASLEPFGAPRSIRPEVRFGHSRLDLYLAEPPPGTYVEVKSVTLIENGDGLFPDAPTLRGARHMEALAAAKAAGYRAAVVFVIQRDDVVGFRPHDAQDPAFGAALRAAARAGVETYAYRCSVTPQEVRLQDPVPVRL